MRTDSRTLRVKTSIGRSPRATIYRRWVFGSEVRLQRFAMVDSTFKSAEGSPQRFLILVDRTTLDIALSWGFCQTIDDTVQDPVAYSGNRRPRWTYRRMFSILRRTLTFIASHPLDLRQRLASSVARPPCPCPCDKAARRRFPAKSAGMRENPRATPRCVRTCGATTARRRRA